MLSSDDEKALQRLIDAYGGHALWRRLKSVQLRVPSLGGALVRMKGKGVTFPPFDRLTIEPHHERVTFHDYPSTGIDSVFQRGRVALGGEPLKDHRATFAGLRKHRRWRPIDVVYFFGYATTTYLSIPFRLPEWATRIEPWDGGLRVAARFPASFHTHSENQAFYFGADGLLVRHDYVADVVSRVARGAHFTDQYTRMHGLPIAGRRIVYARLGRTVSPIRVLDAEIVPLDVELA